MKLLILTVLLTSLHQVGVAFATEDCGLSAPQEIHFPRDEAGFVTTPPTAGAPLASPQSIPPACFEWRNEGQAIPVAARNGYAFAVAVNSVDNLVLVYSYSFPSGGAVLYWTEFDGVSWSSPKRVSPLDDSFTSKPRLARDSGGIIWLVWKNISNGGIWYCTLAPGDTLWSEPARITPVDTLEHYSPVIAHGGGRTWAAWYGTVPGGNPYDVFVAEWTGTSWSAPHNLTASRPGWHWFVDIVVDSQGVPHILWGDSDVYAILYATRDGSGDWTTANQVSFQIVNGWPQCRLAIDELDVIRAVWVTSTLDLVYCTRAPSSGWEEETIQPRVAGGVNYPTVISANGITSAVWYEYAGTAYAVYSMDFGEPPCRIDDGQWYGQVTPECVASSHSLWALWPVFDEYQSVATFLYASRDSNPIPVQLLWFNADVNDAKVTLSWAVSEAVFAAFRVARSSAGLNAQIFTVTAEDQTILSLEDDSAPEGKNVYELYGVTRTGELQRLGERGVEVSRSAAGELRILSASWSQDGSLSLSIEAGQSAFASAQLFDLQGRLLSRRDLGLVHSGMQQVELRSTRPTAPGIYFVKVWTESCTRVLKVPLVR